MEITKIPLSLVSPSPMNPRKTFDEEDLQELADNIEKQGLLQPITVRPKIVQVALNEEVTDGYEIICGERRYRAFSILKAKEDEANIERVAAHRKKSDNFQSITAIVREMSDEEAFDAMITENLQRKDVDPIEEAFAFGQLHKTGKSVEEIAARFGKSIRFVTERIKLNALIPELMVAVRDEKMPIVAAQIICKLEEEEQRRYFNSYQANVSGFTKATAQHFVDDLFMKIDASPWYLSDDQADEDFDGGCGLKCSECPLNTSNHGCLFYEMKCDDSGRCTNREKFSQKTIAFVFHKIEQQSELLVKVGEPLEYGKTVLLDTAYCWNTERQRIHDEVVASIRERGFEIVKPDMFDHRVSYPANDDRIPEMLKNGKCYRCIDIFGNRDVPNPQIVHYYIKAAEKDQSSKPGEIAPPETVKLVGQFKRNLEICNEKIAKNHSDMAKEMGTTRRRGPLKDEEQVGFDALILSQLPSEFFSKYYGLCKSSGVRPTATEILDIAKGNTDDRDLWYREYLRMKISEGWYPGCLQSKICDKVMRQWKPDEVQESDMKLIRATEKKNEKIKQRLEELGYDVHGKKIAVKEQSNVVKPATTAETELLSKYEEMKKKHPDSIILFRLGANYVAIREDAPKVFEQTLTGLDSKNIKGESMQICKFPASILETILPQLIRAGHRVAVCEDTKTNG